MPVEENGGDGVCKCSLSWSVASLPGTLKQLRCIFNCADFSQEKARLKGRGQPDGVHGHQSQNRMFVFQSGSAEGRHLVYCISCLDHVICYSITLVTSV